MMNFGKTNAIGHPPVHETGKAFPSTGERDIDSAAKP